jgi:hypothetical protein
MSLQEFTSKIKNEGLVRTNHYAVEITPPNQADISLDLQLLCSGISTPTTQIAVQEIILPWKSFDNPVKAQFENVTATFYVDGNMVIKSAFDRWLGLIYHNKTGIVGWRNDYITDINIIHKNINDKNLYKIKLIKAFPVGVGGANLTYQAGAPVYELQVTFSYDYWVAYEYDGSDSSEGLPAELSWWQEAQQAAGKVLGVYQDVKNTIGNVKRVQDMGKVGKKANSLDGWIKAGQSGGGAIQGITNIFR